MVIGAWRTEKGKRQRIPGLWRSWRKWRRRRELTASAPRREGHAMSKIVHTFSKTEKKIISPISFSEIDDKRSIP